MLNHVLNTLLVSITYENNKRYPSYCNGYGENDRTSYNNYFDFVIFATDIRDQCTENCSESEIWTRKTVNPLLLPCLSRASLIWRT